MKKKILHFSCGKMLCVCPLLTVHATSLLICIHKVPVRISVRIQSGPTRGFHGSLQPILADSKTAFYIRHLSIPSTHLRIQNYSNMHRYRKFTEGVVKTANKISRRRIFTCDILDFHIRADNFRPL